MQLWPKHIIRPTGITKMEKALCAVVLFLLLLVIGKNSVISSFRGNWAFLRKQIQHQENLYLRHLRIYEQKESVDQIYKNNLDTIEKLEEKIFIGHDINVTAAKLQKAIQDLAKDNNIMIRRIHTEKPMQISGGLYITTIGTLGEAKTMRHLNRFLDQIESHKDKYLYAPRLYLKNIRNGLSFEIQIFSIAMIE